MASLLEVLMGLAPKPTNKEARKLSGPLPEILTADDETPAAWKVVRTKRMAGVDVKGRTMHVPFETSPFALRQRVHEMGHAALTPEKANFVKEAKKAGVPPMLLEAIEDARIHSIMAKDEHLAAMIENGAFDASAPEVRKLSIGLPKWTQRLPQDERMALGAALFLSCANTPNEEVGAILAEACGTPLPPLQKAAERVREQPFSKATEVVSAMWRELNDQPKMKKPEPDDKDGSEMPSGGSMEGGGGSPSTAPPSSSGGGGKKTSAPSPSPAASPPPVPKMETTQEWRDKSVFAPIIAPSKEALEQDAVGEGEGEGEGQNDPRLQPHVHNLNPSPTDGVTPSGRKYRLEDYVGISNWGEMDIEELPLSVALKRPRKHQVRTPRHCDDGGNLGAIHRLRIDGKVFRRKQHERAKKRIGTLLLDASGSMSIMPEDVERMLELAPQATIAMYSGHNREGLAGHGGRLWILARKRRRCSDSVFGDSGGWALEGKTAGNIVDGPALRWLMKQPGPRIWVSDGGVTGKGDSPADNLHSEVREILAAGRILQLPTLDTLFEEATEFSQDFINFAALQVR